MIALKSSYEGYSVSCSRADIRGCVSKSSICPGWRIHLLRSCPVRCVELIALSSSYLTERWPFFLPLLSPLSFCFVFIFFFFFFLCSFVMPINCQLHLAAQCVKCVRVYLAAECFGPVAITRDMVFGRKHLFPGVFLHLVALTGHHLSGKLQLGKPPVLTDVCLVSGYPD